MLKIRLMRIGGKKKPFYRVVVVEERSKRTGGYTELLGTYNPLTTPKDIKLKQDRIDYWIKQGAQPSTGFLRIIGKAPQRLPRKPKKEKKEEPKAPEVKTEEVKVEPARNASPARNDVALSGEPSDARRHAYGEADGGLAGGEPVVTEEVAQEEVKTEVVAEETKNEGSA